MPKYKVHIDKPLPDSKRIESFKNFDSLYEQYQVSTRFEFWRNLYRKPIYFASLLAIIAIGFLVFEATTNVPEQEMAFINPPIPPKDIQPVGEQYTGDEPLTFSYQNGSQIIVPPHAFVDQDGKEIMGAVELRYREFRDVAEIFLGGVPMEYDTAGQTHTLESAGMLEITAYKDGQAVMLKEDKNIEVQYVSNIGSKDFNVYYLDTTDRNWVYQGKDDVEEIIAEVKPETGLQSVKDLDEDAFLTKNVRIPPPKPQRLFWTNFGPDTETVAAFYDQAGAFWEWVEVPEFEKPWQGNPPVAEMPLTRVERYRMPGVFKLTFTGDDGLHQLIASPVTSIANAAEADSWYQSKLADYQAKMSIWERDQAEIKQQRQAREEARKRQEAWKKEMARKQAEAGATFKRTFTIHQLGITQIGRKVAQPPAQKLLTFSDLSDQNIARDLVRNGRTVYTVIPNINTLFRCEVQDAKAGVFKVFFDPGQASPIWSSTESEDLLLLDASDFPPDATASSSKVLSLPFTQVKTTSTDAAALKQILFDSIQSDPAE